MVPGFRGLSREHTQIFALLEHLRAIAGRLRTSEAQPFYSTREAAAFFGVSQPTVVRVYRELEAEGLLARRRSTLTMLTPLERRPRAPVRGVVGLPIWSYGHSRHSDWRLFFVRLEEHLRHHAFVADFIFFQRADPQLPDQVDRYLNHELDALIWLYPLPAYTPLMLQLADQGVAVAVVVDQRARFPFPTFGVSWAQAVQDALKAWKAQGIRRICVAGNAPDATPIVPAVKRLGFEMIPSGKAMHAEDILRRCRGMHDLGVLLPDPAWYAALPGGAHAQPFLELLQRHRTLLFHHIELDQTVLKGIRADFAIIDWDKLAATLADRLASGALRRQSEPVAAQAGFFPQQPAERFPQLF